MRLTPATSEHLAILRSWFPDRESAERWGGPTIRYPWTRKTFLEDIHWGQLPSWACLDDQGRMVGFGQYYKNRGRCRLARLVVAPAVRGKGVGRRMIAELIRIGLADVGAAECSLVVLSGNLPAIRCYRSLGFAKAEYPDREENVTNALYMVRPAS